MNAVTIRSAAPLSIIAWPAIAASAITMPMVPAVRPKPSATRAIFAAGSPGASRLTTIAAGISARDENGKAAGRGRVEKSGVAVSFKKKKKMETNTWAEGHRRRGFVKTTDALNEQI